MDETIVQDAVDKVEEILSPKKFNLIDAVQGKAYPEDSVRIFLDEEAAYELTQVNAQLEELSRIKDRDESTIELYNVTEALAQELKDRLIASSLKFTLRGRGHKVYDEIADRTAREFADVEDDSERGVVENIRIIAASTVSVENGEGAIDGDREFTEEDITPVYELASPGEWKRLLDLMMALAFANTYFDKAVRAGFLSRH